MPSSFVLVHSPLVGPQTWALVTERLCARGMTVIVPELADRDADPTPYWQQHAVAAAAAMASLPGGSRPWLVGHSGAGALLPAIRQQWGRPVGGYCFVDAGIPRDDESRLGAADSADFVRQLRPLLLAGGRFPNWTDDILRPVVPNDALRQRLLAGLRPRLLRFWEEPVPVFAGWPDASCTYLQFGAPYDAAAEGARTVGWPYRHMPAGHFHMLIEPGAVADALVDLAEEAEAAAGPP